MDSFRSSSALSRRAKDSMPSFSLYPSVVTKDSKAQHILGISRTELHNARSESLKPKPRHRASSSSLKSSTYSPFAWSRDKHAAISVDEVSEPNDLEERNKSSSIESDARSLSQTTSLNRYPSTSTLRSLYDTATAPLRNAQQHSDYTSQISPRKSDASAVLRSREQGQDQSRSLRFFKSPKLRSIVESRKIEKDFHEVTKQPTFSPASRGSSLSISTGKSPLLVDGSILTSTSSHTSPDLDHMENTFPKTGLLAAREPHQEVISDTPVPASTLPTPYAKVHIRRPKAGTKNWFDDLGDVVSDEDLESEPEPAFIDDNGDDDDDHRDISFDQSVDTSTADNNLSTNPTFETTHHQDDESLDLLAEAPVVSTPNDQSPLEEQVCELSASPLQPTARPSVQADLSQESNLCLSGPTKGCADNDTLVPLQPVQSSTSLPAIRESIAIDTCDESDVEFGFAHAIETTGKTRGSRPSPIKVVKTRDYNNTPEPLPSEAALQTTPIIVDSDAESIQLNDTDPKDANEDALLDSFPATPTDTRARRTSSRSSLSFSDDTSVMSMRLMRVTRQEENLIAAMRMKRATMKRADRAAARKSALRMLEQDEKIVVSTNRLSAAERMAEMRRATMIQYGARLQLAGLGLYDNDAIRQDTRSTTAMFTAPHEIGSSQIPVRSRSTHKIDRQSAKVLPPVLEPSVNIDELFSRRPSDSQPRPQSFQSTASEGSRIHEGNIIVLDNLGSALPSQVFPSQLFIESPFTSWDRVDAAAIHRRYSDIDD